MIAYIVEHWWALFFAALLVFVLWISWRDRGEKTGAAETAVIAAAATSSSDAGSADGGGGGD